MYGLITFDTDMTVKYKQGFMTFNVKYKQQGNALHVFLCVFLMESLIIL